MSEPAGGPAQARRPLIGAVATLRRPSTSAAARVAPLELFYDLVFVFAITQVAHHLAAHLTRAGAWQAGLLLTAVWWSWNYTAWVTNELDTDQDSVRLMVLAVMLGSLLMAIAIPRAFAGRGLLFAVAYVAIQLGRHVFLALWTARRGSLARTRATRILLWFAASAPLWVAGGAAGPDGRVLLWTAAALVDLSGPLCTYRVPGLARLEPGAWQVASSHFAERFQLFVLIALGESVVVTGTTTADLALTPARAAALLVAFLATAALWWLYFDRAAASGEHLLASETVRRTQAARDSYTYLHGVLVGAIIAAAVGDELVIAHPGEVLPLSGALTVCGGPALYLLALFLFRRRTTGSWSLPRVCGAVACVLVIPLGGTVPALACAALVLAVLLLVALVELRSRRGASPSQGAQGPANTSAASTS